MRAIYTTKQGHFSITDRPKPHPRHDEVLIRVIAAGLCPNEIRIRGGLIEPVNYPLIPGHQFAGIVESLGSTIRHMKKGDAVSVHPYIVCGECSSCRSAAPAHECERFMILGRTMDGGLTEYCTVPARHLYKLPNHVTIEAGALIENLANGVACARNADLHIGEKVVVIGAWSVAMLTLQVARLHNPRILILAGTGHERLKKAKRLGATHTVDLDDKDALEHLKETLGGKGADVILMCGTTVDELNIALNIVAIRGRIVIEGHFDPNASLTFSPFDLLISHSATLRANRGFTTPDYERAHQMISNRIIDVKSLITARFSIEDWESAFDTFSSPTAQAIQVIITP